MPRTSRPELRAAVAHIQDPKTRQREYMKIYQREIVDNVARNRFTREKRSALRAKILDVYSDGYNECAVCGFSDTRALDLDHIGNAGGEHRRRIGRRGVTYEIYLELKKAGFPPGYQILCRNCNWDKQVARWAERRASNAS